jgi:hypothetical protein
MTYLTTQSIALLSIPSCMLILYLLDKYIQSYQYSPNHRWCCIHCFGNIVVVCCSFKATVTLLSSDLTIANEHNIDLSSCVIVMAMHMYHLMMYEIRQTSILVHHIVMMSVLTIPFYYYDNEYFIIFSNYSLFFLCGLPGGIDYYLMHLVYTKKISKLTEKHINTQLNAYIRSPGILYGVFYVYRGYVNGMNIPFIYIIIIICTYIWNAQFFSSEVAISYGYTLAKIKNN